MATKKRPATYRLSEHARSVIARLADLHGVSQTAVLEMAIREKARRDLPAGPDESATPKGKGKK